MWELVQYFIRAAAADWALSTLSKWRTAHYQYRVLMMCHKIMFISRKILIATLIYPPSKNCLPYVKFMITICKI